MVDRTQQDAITYSLASRAKNAVAARTQIRSAGRERVQPYVGKRGRFHPAYSSRIDAEKRPQPMGRTPTGVRLPQPGN